ncbi:hypothetical protein D1007_05966 [Hordeum vulgare]|nr:hypothetical protein D1007_05966 [Hordeum vulgare]
MAAVDETTLKLEWEDDFREDMERQHRTLEEIAARRRGHEEGGIVILNNGDEEAPRPSNPVFHGDPGQGCSKDGDRAHNNDRSDYTNFYKLLGMMVDDDDPWYDGLIKEFVRQHRACAIENQKLDKASTRTKDTSSLYGFVWSLSV